MELYTGFNIISIKDVDNGNGVHDLVLHVEHPMHEASVNIHILGECFTDGETIFTEDYDAGVEHIALHIPTEADLQEIRNMVVYSTSEIEDGDTRE